MLLFVLLYPPSSFEFLATNEIVCWDHKNKAEFVEKSKEENNNNI